VGRAPFRKGFSAGRFQSGRALPSTPPGGADRRRVESQPRVEKEEGRRERLALLFLIVVEKVKAGERRDGRTPSVWRRCHPPPPGLSTNRTDGYSHMNRDPEQIINPFDQMGRLRPRRWAPDFGDDLSVVLLVAPGEDNQGVLASTGVTQPAEESCPVLPPALPA
jgi:hypothetical protein